MKERTLNFDFNNDETPVEVNDEKKAKLEKSANELKQHIGMLMYLINGNSLTASTRDAIMSIIDNNTQSICNLFDYGTYLKKQQEKTLNEIRELNLENHELRQQLGQKVSTEDMREKMKMVIYGFEHWAKTKGFGWMHDVQVDNYGTLIGVMSTRISRIRSLEKEVRKRVAELGFEFEDIEEDDAMPIANDKNLRLIRELVKSLSPDAIADDVIISRRGDVPHIKSVKIILREWNCLDSYIQEYIEEEQKQYGRKR